jgi:hypothetical protein
MGCRDRLPSSFPACGGSCRAKKWGPIGEDRVRGEVSIEPHGAPGSAAGTALLAPTRNGSRLKCNATVEFKIPMVGGTVESITAVYWSRTSPPCSA